MQMSIESQSIKDLKFNFPNQSGVYHGKVRDVYSVGEKLVMVASDRISALKCSAANRPTASQSANTQGRFSTGEFIHTFTTGTPDCSAALANSAVVRAITPSYRHSKKGCQIVDDIGIPSCHVCWRGGTTQTATPVVGIQKVIIYNAMKGECLCQCRGTKQAHAP